MHQRYEPSAFDRHPGVQRATRAAVAAGVVAMVVAAWMTAGPGNGWQPAREHVAVTLPAVTVVGHRSSLTAADMRPAVTCERTAFAAPERARKMA
ncbi:hypothetical protein [Ramlibacter algicola]|uniref:Uncharacterized protein n=1 Tax=Ramlibacter algicola TaxID=2795217 RepID=A0A934UQZ5_9BURK|nr:hypothetical protein [Ramlibacter algicola]MBK0392153.1 hypothetical protein [Ramlibacter algicola]